MSSSPRGGRVRGCGATEVDASAIAKLAGELGYPSTSADIVRRMRNLEPRSRHTVLVAESSSGEAIGWAHVSVNCLIESETRAELNGLVIAEGHRSLGAGALLLEAGGRWGRGQGCATSQAPRQG